MPHVLRNQTTQQLRDDLTGKKSRRRAGTGVPQQGGFGEGGTEDLGVTPRGTTTLEKRIKKIRATKQGATDVAGTARKAPTSRGSGRKTVVKGDPVKPRRRVAPPSTLSPGQVDPPGDFGKRASAALRGEAKRRGLLRGQRNYRGNALGTEGGTEDLGATPRGTTTLEKRRKKVLARQAHEERRSTALKTRGAGKARAIKQGQAGRTERARRKSSM